MIVSCGDSFFYGIDLADCSSWASDKPDNPPSQYTWPALLAHRLGKPYRSMAFPGVGNLQILQQVIRAVDEYKDSAFYIINWSWIERFDYYDKETDRCERVNSGWRTVRPSQDDGQRDMLYYKYFHSELFDKFTSLIYINQAISNLEKYHCRYFMTYMDSLFLDERWHAPGYVRFLQQEVKPKLNDFNGFSFLEWSRSNHFPESHNSHPLEKAHESAADFWYPTIKNLL